MTTALAEEPTQNQTAKPGTCQFCGCTDDRACYPVACSWANAARTVCTTDRCLDQAAVKGVSLD